MIKVLFLGEIIGIPTVKLLKKNLKKIKEELGINFVIANADGASDGYGILNDTAYQIKNSGVDIITTGDFIFNKKDIKDTLTKSSFLLRPYNLPTKSAGRGIFLYKLSENISIGVVNILGRINFNKIFASDPYSSVDNAIEKLKDQTNIIIVDYHGGATSEIQSMYWYLSGRVSAVLGTHLRVLTSDNRVIKDTAVITGTGFCGGNPGINGMSCETEIKKIKTGQFVYSKIISENVILQGVTIDIDEVSGKATSIDLFEKKIN